MTIGELRRELFRYNDQELPVVVSCEQLTACEPFDLGRVVGVEVIDGMAVLQIASPEATIE
jgi:hypothetical protein